MLGLFRSPRAAAIDERAHRAATSPRNDRPEPTRAQMDAGNYKHGHVQVQGLRIAIENPAGSVRSGVTAEGRIWRTVLKHHYGRLKGTEGADDDQVDVFIGPHPESGIVFVIDQVIDGRFDEHKVILGVTTEAEARALYLANYQPGWRGLGAVTSLPIGEFKEWLANHDTRAPMATNRLPAPMQFMKALAAIGRRILAKSTVLRPGSRGGHYYVDHGGRIRYGTQPVSTAPPFHGATSVKQVPKITTKRSGMFAGRSVSSTADTAEIFREIVDHDRERFWMLHLASNGRPLAVECISQGSLTASMVVMRETFKNALNMGTKRVAFVHNHPSANPHPSPEDVSITSKLREAAQLIGIDVAHHVVVGSDGYADVEHPVPHAAWAPPSTEKRRELRHVEGTIKREQPSDAPWTFGQRISGSDDVAAMGRVLFDPGDRIAVALLLDAKMRAVGVYPVAHERFDAGFASRVATVAAGSNAVSMVLVVSADGPDWQSGADLAHQTAKDAAGQMGVGLVDTVAVAGLSHRSVVDDGSVSGGPRWP